MTYLLKNTRKNTRNIFGNNLTKIFVVFFFIFIFIFILNIWSLTKSLVSNILSPFFGVGTYFYENTLGISKLFYNKAELVKENSELRNKLENNNLDIVDYQSVKYENQKLREELNLKESGDFIASSIIAKAPQIPLDSLFIDKGSKDGLKNGDLVLARERVLLGKIVKVSQNRATVVLNSFAGTVSYGNILRTNETLEIIGFGGGSIKAKVPIDFDIIVGDKIMILGSTSYLAAIVAVIEEDKTSGLKDVFMSLPVEISKSNIVFVESLIVE